MFHRNICVVHRNTQCVCQFKRIYIRSIRGNHNSIYIYIYMYICVCVCVYVCVS